MVKVLLFAAVLGASLSANALSNRQTCINRIEAQCRVNVWNAASLERNAQECKQVAPGTEAVLLNSGKVSVINTRSYPCTGVQYRIDGAGIKETKVIQQKLYMISNDGQAYFMGANQELYEILNSDRRSYKTIVDINGLGQGRAVEFVLRNGQPLVMDYQTILRKGARGELRPLYIYNTASFLGLFY